MGRGFGAIAKTNKCICENPKWSIVHKHKIMSGKQIGKIIYMLRCSNCGSQWETSAKYAKELDI